MLTTLSGDLATTHRLELGAPSIVPAGVWQGAHTLGEWTLVTCWCAPAYTDDCFTVGERAALSTEFPGVVDQIHALTRHPDR